VTLGHVVRVARNSPRSETGRDLLARSCAARPPPGQHSPVSGTSPRDNLFRGNPLRPFLPPATPGASLHEHTASARGPLGDAPSRRAPLRTERRPRPHHPRRQSAPSGEQLPIPAEARRGRRRATSASGGHAPTGEPPLEPVIHTIPARPSPPQPMSRSSRRLSPRHRTNQRGPPGITRASCGLRLGATLPPAPGSETTPWSRLLGTRWQRRLLGNATHNPAARCASAPSPRLAHDRRIDVQKQHVPATRRWGIPRCSTWNAQWLALARRDASGEPPAALSTATPHAGSCTREQARTTTHGTGAPVRRPRRAVQISQPDARCAPARTTGTHPLLRPTAPTIRRTPAIRPGTPPDAAQWRPPRLLFVGPPHLTLPVWTQTGG
jgi:hypothetical protein